MTKIVLGFQNIHKGDNPFWGRLESGPRLVGRIGSGVRVSASLQIFALRMLLHSVGVTSGGGFLGDNLWGNVSRGGGLSQNYQKVT